MAKRNGHRRLDVAQALESLAEDVRAGKHDDTTEPGLLDPDFRRCMEDVVEYAEGNISREEMLEGM